LAQVALRQRAKVPRVVNPIEEGENQC
jgi:hypothetical protein